MQLALGLCLLFVCDSKWFPLDIEQCLKALFNVAHPNREAVNMNSQEHFFVQTDVSGLCCLGLCFLEESRHFLLDAISER